jgi:hypothetical protein
MGCHTSQEQRASLAALFYTRSCQNPQARPRQVCGRAQQAPKHACTVVPVACTTCPAHAQRAQQAHRGDLVLVLLLELADAQLLGLVHNALGGERLGLYRLEYRHHGVLQGALLVLPLHLLQHRTSQYSWLHE